jgi:hypothetical protein
MIVPDHSLRRLDVAEETSQIDSAGRQGGPAQSRSASFLALLVSMLLNGGYGYENRLRLFSALSVKHRF